MDAPMLEEIKNLLSVYGGGIKSVQKGSINENPIPFDANVGGVKNLRVPINPVDTAKSFVIHDIKRISNVQADSYAEVASAAVDGNELSIRIGFSMGINRQTISFAGRWYLIEFK